MWKTVLQELAPQLGYFAIAAFIVAWLLRQLVTHWLDKDVESYKSRLRMENETELERLRNQLEMRAVEHEIRFRSLHEEQAQVIAEVYARLQALLDNVQSYVSPFGVEGGPTQQEQFENVSESYSHLVKYYQPKAIYIPKESRGKIDKLLNKVKKIAQRMKQDHKYGKNLQDSARQRGEKPRSLWQEAREMLRSDIPPLLEELEEEFQNILGVKKLNGISHVQQEKEEEG